MLENFFIIDLEFFIRFEKPVTITSDEVGPMLRGAFGTQLRRIVCHNLRFQCWECPVRPDCAYEKIFSPHVPPKEVRLSKQRDMPRGFILKPPLGDADYGKDRLFAFRMILVGELINWLPYIIVPFSELGRIGIGRQRTPYQLENIRSREAGPGQSKLIYDRAENLVHVDRIIKIYFNDLQHKTDFINREAVTLRFLTPTTLKFNPEGFPGGSVISRVPEFHVLIKRLRDRVNRLATVYCREEMDIDYKDYGRRSEKIKIDSVHGGWVERKRKTRSGLQQDLGGFVGDITYTGPISEFMPLLMLGQYVHAGKNAVFGGGWYEIIRRNSDR